MNDKTQMRPGGMGPRKQRDGQVHSQSEQNFAHQEQAPHLPEQHWSKDDSDDEVTQLRRNHSQDRYRDHSADGFAGHTGAEPYNTGPSPGYTPNYQQIERPTFSGGDNHSLCVVDTVTPLLSMAGKLQSATAHPDLLQFKRYAESQIQYYDSIDFGMKTEDSPFDRALVGYARYGLCALIDDLILNTPWGNGSGWSQNSLSLTFFREAWGGKKFFDYLEQMKKQAAQCLPVLSLYYVCLELGFMGRYRDQGGGLNEHHRIKKDLFLLIDRQIPRIDQTLSPHWQGAEEQGKGIIKHIPLWVMAALTATVGLLIYAGFYFTLSDLVEPVNLDVNKVLAEKPIKVQPRNFNRLGQSQSPTTTDIVVVEEPQIEEPDLVPLTIDYKDKLSGLLAAEISKGTVKLDESEDEILIKLMVVDSELFASASATLGDEYMAIVDKVGRFLADSPIEATVTGHTDNLPIRSSIKYPNNLALSQARAEQVRKRLVQKSGKSGIRAFGMADAFAVASNTTAEGRRQNRRVEISLSK